MPWTSSCSAAVTTSSTARLCPRWITSAPLACRMRRMMLMAASWPSKSDAAVTKRILFFVLYSVCREALRSVMAAPMRPDLAGETEATLRLRKRQARSALMPQSIPSRGGAFLSDRRVAQPQRVEDDRHRARAHRGGCKHRVQKQAGPGEEHPRRNRHAESVVDERQEQILADIAHRGARKPPRANDTAQVAFDERDPRALDRHVRPGAHCDADVGLGERGRVVHAVARHRHGVTLLAQRFHDGAFLLGEYVRVNFLDPEPPGHRP